MNEEEYLSTRLDDQLAWYERKANLARRRYKTLRAVEFTSAALVPVAVVLGSSLYYRLAAACLGALAAAATGLQSANHYQQNWVEYRAVAERLRSMRFAFLAKTAPYDGDDGFKVFVSRVEEILCGEHASWGGRMGAKPDKSPLPDYLG